MFIAALPTRAKTGKQPQCSSTDGGWRRGAGPWWCTAQREKNEIMPFAVARMDLEIIILSEPERQITISYCLHVESKIWHKWTYLRSRNRLTDTEDSCGCRGWGRRDGLGVWDQQRQTLIYRMGEHYGPALQHKELDAVPCDKPELRSIWKRMYMYDWITLLWSRD